MNNNDNTSVIQAPHYQLRVAELISDPIIRDMAADLPTSTDTSTHEFMMASLQTYNERGGKIQTHIGGPAEALRLLTKHTKRYSCTLAGESMIARAKDENHAASAFTAEAVRLNLKSEDIGPIKEID